MDEIESDINRVYALLLENSAVEDIFRDSSLLNEFIINHSQHITDLRQRTNFFKQECERGAEENWNKRLKIESKTQFLRHLYDSIQAFQRKLSDLIETNTALKRDLENSANLIPSQEKLKELTVNENDIISSFFTNELDLEEFITKYIEAKKALCYLDLKIKRFMQP